MSRLCYVFFQSALHNSIKLNAQHSGIKVLGPPERGYTMSSYLVFILNGKEIVDVEELVRKINLIVGRVNLEILARGGNLLENKAKVDEFKNWVVQADAESLLSYP